MTDAVAAADMARLALAKTYPYNPPRRSFLYYDGVARPLDRPDVEDRVPVLAYGSNAAPAQLARKYSGWPAGTAIPVTRARLSGFDIVHSAHFSRYGALPAMLWPAPGVTVQIAVLWLSPAQLARLHETEGALNYRYRRLDGLDLGVEGIGALTSVHAYVGLHGPVARGGAVLALAAIPARGRRLPAFHQADALAVARDVLAPGAPLDPFIVQTVVCPVTRIQRTARLEAAALPVWRP
ncbi:MAG: gamma-glutamylcyclotransferase family protein [Inquilinaceae bacterium]